MPQRIESCARTWGGVEGKRVAMSTTIQPDYGRRNLMKKHGARKSPRHKHDYPTLADSIIQLRTEEALLRCSKIMSLSTETSLSENTYIAWCWRIARLRKDGLSLLGDENDTVSFLTAEAPDRIIRFVTSCLKRFKVSLADSPGIVGKVLLLQSQAYGGQCNA